MIEAHFNNIQRVLLNEVARAEKAVDIAVAWFSTQSLFDLLCQKLDHNVSVRIATRNDYKNNHEGALDWQVFIDKGGRLFFDNRHLLHHKFCVIDHRIVLTGSYNWTYNAEFRNAENILLTDSENVVQQYSVQFEQITRNNILVQTNKRVQRVELSADEIIFYEREIQLDKPSSGELIDRNGGDTLDLAWVSYRKKDYSCAKIQLQLVIQRNPDLLSAYSLLSAIYLQEGFYQKGIEIGQKALGDRNLDADVYNTIGLAYDKLKNWNQALYYFNQSIGIESEESIYYWNKLEALLEIGLHTEADKTALIVKEVAAKTIRINKGLFNRDLLKARISIGFLCRQIGSIDDALKHGEKAFLIYKNMAQHEQDLHDLDDIQSLLKG